MGHGKYAPVVVLVVTFQFAFDGISGSTSAGAGRVATLHDKIGNNPVERYTIVISRLSQLQEVGNGAWRIRVVKLHGEVAFFGLDNRFTHFFKFGTQT